MCIKIINTENEQEFNPMEPLEDQVGNAKEILVTYEPYENRKINSFVREIERMVLSGISCNAEIKIEANNYLDGIKLEREIEGLKRKLNVNEVAKKLTAFHSEVDRKLRELSIMCGENK